MTEPITESTTDITDLRRRAREAIESTNISIRELALRIGARHSSVARWLKGEAFGGEQALVEPKIRAWLDELDEQAAATDAAPALGPADFIETPTAERIMSALAYAQASRDMVSIVGAPGTGKTYAIKRFASLYRDVWHATITPACSTVVPALEEVAEAVGLREISAGARYLSRAIRARVRDTKGILVVDEFQLLSLGAIEELRAIHDAEGVAIALVGNEVGYARMSGSRAAHHAQIYSRLGMRLHITPPSPRDVLRLAERENIEEPKSLTLLERIGSRPGGLRSVTKVIRFAKAAGQQPTFAMLKAAADNLGADE